MTLNAVLPDRLPTTPLAVRDMCTGGLLLACHTTVYVVGHQYLQCSRHEANHHPAGSPNYSGGVNFRPHLTEGECPHIIAAHLQPFHPAPYCQLFQLDDESTDGRRNTSVVRHGLLPSGAG